jgi:hypothetical protein
VAVADRVAATKLPGVKRYRRAREARAAGHPNTVKGTHARQNSDLVNGRIAN